MTISAPRRRRIGFDLTALALVGVLLIGALGAGAVVVYRELYSPAAFVSRYLDLLGDRRAADALLVPGVAVSSAELEAAGLPTSATEALLRSTALTSLTDVELISSEEKDGVTEVTMSYSAGPYDGQSTFEVEQAGWIGIVPSWRFVTSPLAVIDLTVAGSSQFSVNGFEVDKRQVASEGANVEQLAPVPMLVFSPGLYSIEVDTALSTSPGVAVLSDTPEANIPVNVQTEPTDEFIGVVQDRVEEFLTGCASQEVLQPTGCPFGYFVRNRITDVPHWTITEQPEVSVVADGANWAIPRIDAMAQITVPIQSLYDGTIEDVTEDVPFAITGAITILPDGTASIQVSAVE